ncbi:MAG: hypothetical protein K2H96_02155 [Muribaculaceae bacterium]|nr:hypothetical protein [Muribaculaceae bacterium]
MGIRKLWHEKKKDIPAVILFLGVSVMLVFSCLWAYDKFMTSAPYVSYERYPIRGIDVSRHNGMMNLDAAASDGIEFIFIKASEGEGLQDENFHLNYDKAGHAGLKRGAYHFFRFDKDGISQGQNFMRAVGGRPLELGVVIDIEESGNAKDVTHDQIMQRLADMVEYLNMHGYRVMFYTNRQGYEDFLMNNYTGMPLWICHFSSTPFDADWTFWQFDHHGKVKGIPSEVDLNVFVGSRKDWEEYLLTAQTQ